VESGSKVEGLNRNGKEGKSARTFDDNIFFRYPLDLAS